MHLSKKQQEGFTLIELGIVVAIIALLSTSVLLGKGFIDASKISRAAEAVEKTRIAVETYIGRNGGNWEMVEYLEYNGLATKLVDRKLVPEMPWQVGAIEIDLVAYTTITNHDAVYVRGRGPQQSIAHMMVQLQNQKHFLNGTAAAPSGCSEVDQLTPDANGNALALLCFQRRL